MTLEEIKNALEEVQHMCKKTPQCGEACPFHNDYAAFTSFCLVNGLPEEWLIDNIKIKERGD